MISRIKRVAQKNKCLNKLITVIELTKATQYMRPLMPLIWNRREFLSRTYKRANDTSAEFRACYETHKNDFDQVESMLDDDFSRRTLQTVIRFRLSPNIKILLPIINLAQYFPRPIMRKAENEVFIDAGGYIGDTIIALASFWGKNSWKKVYAWEPDDNNRSRLIKNIELFGFKNVEVIPWGLWSEKTELSFKMMNNMDSKVSDAGTVRIQVDTIDNLCFEEKVTFIKIDIEGSEMQALRGAKNVICRDKPRLAVSIYHKPEDYYEIPLYIKKLVPEYRLYIRHHKLNKNDTVCYAVYPQ